MGKTNKTQLISKWDEAVRKLKSVSYEHSKFVRIVADAGISLANGNLQLYIDCEIIRVCNKKLALNADFLIKKKRDQYLDLFIEMLLLKSQDKHAKYTKRIIEERKLQEEEAERKRQEEEELLLQQMIEKEQQIKNAINLLREEGFFIAEDEIDAAMQLQQAGMHLVSNECWYQLVLNHSLVSKLLCRCKK